MELLYGPIVNAYNIIFLGLLISMKKPNYVKPFILSLILVILGFGTYWLEFKKKPNPENEVETGKKVFPFLANATIKKISIYNPKKNHHFLFECLDYQDKKCTIADKSRWQMIEPKLIKADDASVDQLLTTMQHLIVAQVIDVDQEDPNLQEGILRDYHVAQQDFSKALKISLELESKSIDLIFGEKHPMADEMVGNSTAAVLSDKPHYIFMIPNHFLANLEKSLTHWRDKKLFELDKKDIEGIQLITSNQQIIQIKKKDNVWNLMNKNIDYPADPDKIESLMNTLTSLKVQQFLAENAPQTKTLLNGAKHTFKVLVQKQNRNIIINFYNKMIDQSEKTFLTLSARPGAFEIDPTVKTKLDKTISELRVTHLIKNADRFQIESFTISSKDYPNGIKLNKKADEQWTFENNGQPIPFAEAKINHFLEVFFQDNIKNFVPKKIPPHEHLKVIVQYSQKEQKKSLLFWKEANHVYCKDLDSTQDEVFLMDPTIANLIPWDKEFFNQKNEV